MTTTIFPDGDFVEADGEVRLEKLERPERADLEAILEHGGVGPPFDDDEGMDVARRFYSGVMSTAWAWIASRRVGGTRRLPTRVKK